ncbi:hypothetical protein C8R47DRAFT_1078462 [Mycena vitilis]|nr:hypothetical protein C8R47DRAFT_1078462 [Mycena vitilis]
MAEAERGSGISMKLEEMMFNTISLCAGRMNQSLRADASMKRSLTDHDNKMVRAIRLVCCKMSAAAFSSAECSNLHNVHPSTPIYGILIWSEGAGEVLRLELALLTAKGARGGLVLARELTGRHGARDGDSLAQDPSGLRFSGPAMMRCTKRTSSPVVTSSRFGSCASRLRLSEDRRRGQGCRAGDPFPRPTASSCSVGPTSLASPDRSGGAADTPPNLGQFCEFIFTLLQASLEPLSARRGAARIQLTGAIAPCGAVNVISRAEGKYSGARDRLEQVQYSGPICGGADCAGLELDDAGKGREMHGLTVSARHAPPRPPRGCIQLLRNSSSNLNVCDEKDLALNPRIGCHASTTGVRRPHGSARPLWLNADARSSLKLTRNCSWWL